MNEIQAKHVDLTKEYFLLERYRITQEVNRPYVNLCSQILIITILAPMIENILGLFIASSLAYEASKNMAELSLTYAHTIAGVRMFTVGAISSMSMAGAAFISQSLYVANIENDGSILANIFFVCGVLLFSISLICFTFGAWLFVGL